MEELIISNLGAKVLLGEANKEVLENYYDSIMDCVEWAKNRAYTYVLQNVRLVYVLVEFYDELNEMEKYECFVMGYKGTLEESFGKDYEKLSQWLEKTIAWENNKNYTSHKLQCVLEIYDKQALECNALYLHTNNYDISCDLMTATDDHQVID